MFLVNLACPTKSVRSGPRSQRHSPSEVFVPQAAAGTCCGQAVWLHPPLLRAGCPSRKLAASEPPVRLDANTNSSPLPLASAYPREPLLHGTAAGPGWPSTKAHRSGLPKVGSTSSKERMRQLIVLVHTGVSSQEPQQTRSQSVFSSKRRNITLRCTRRPSGARELKR